MGKLSKAVVGGRGRGPRATGGGKEGCRMRVEARRLRRRQAAPRRVGSQWQERQAASGYREQAQGLT